MKPLLIVGIVLSLILHVADQATDVFAGFLFYVEGEHDLDQRKDAKIASKQQFLQLFLPTYMKKIKFSWLFLTNIVEFAMAKVILHCAGASC